jgi:hypothetical protein
MGSIINNIARSIAAESNSGGGIPSIATIELLLAIESPSIGDQYFVEEEGEVRTYCDLGGRNLWLLDRWVRKTDGTLYTTSIGQDVDENELDVYGGMTIPGTWPAIGTQTVNSDHVVFNGVVYPNSASTVEKYILYLEMYDNPPTGTTLSGMAGLLGGSILGGTSRVTGIKFASSGAGSALDMGHYSASQALGGTATFTLGKPVECFVDLSGTDALSIVKSGKGEIITKRSSILTGTRFFEVGAIDGSANAINNFKVKRAVFIELS